MIQMRPYGNRKAVFRQSKKKAEEYYFKAWTAYNDDDLETASFNAELALQKDPSHHGARFMLLEIYLKKQKKTSKAIPHLEYIADSRKHRYYAWVNLYNIYAKANQPDKVVSMYQKHIAHLKEKTLSDDEKGSAARVQCQRTGAPGEVFHQGDAQAFQCLQGSGAVIAEPDGDSDRCSH